ncbi:ChbG/HpnK family deacetylase [Aquincola sp. S2]|uniref:ChbG/HpnK family deacetylase n=1 Tax=Pseudaquabacterium terrae TaxID=2732868 RepID=A0ABX2EQF2_9BURK|nr:ChbG/HpnK family deacetylase [Aquabacterium terrae]
MHRRGGSADECEAQRLRRIAVCADDFGLRCGINEAIVALAQAGRLTAVSCMVEAPAWGCGLPALRRLDRGGIDIGLHLDVGADAAPLALPALILRAYSGRLDRALLRQRIEVQLTAFEQALGRPPDFVDGHRHVHQLPLIGEALLAVLDERYPQRRPWLRRTRAPAGRLHGLAGGKAALVAALGGHRFAEAAQRLGYPLNARLLGVYDFHAAAAAHPRRLQQWLAQCGDGDLLMCHPALPDGTPDPIGRARENEFAQLRGADFAVALRQAGVALVRLSRWLAPAVAA